MSPAAAEPAPWWAEGGPDAEVCPFCHQSYAYEIEVRCIECDGPLCPVCAVSERLTVTTHLCPECTEEAEAGEGGA